MPIIDGKRVVNLPGHASGEDVKRAVGETRPGRKVIIRKPEGNITVSDFEKVRIEKEDKLSIVPDRVKASGTYSYGAPKTEHQKQIIFSQVSDIEKNWFKSGIEIDKDFHWIKIPGFKLPQAWADANNNAYTDLLIIIPDQFPNLPPNGFYLPNNINSPHGDGHFFDRGHGGAFGSTDSEINEMRRAGWKWYCSHIKPESWSPSRIRNILDWKKGDNLWDVLDLIKDVLTDPYGA